MKTALKKLLLVDDDAFLRDMYAIKFGDSGYDVQVAETAHKALSIIEQSPDLDVILLDMVMPGMSGIELIKEIKASFPELHAVCIVLSNQGEDSDITAATKVGAAGYIVKAESIPSDVVKQVAKIIGDKE
jgi:CheY-like chemotaxis protein